MKHRLSLLAALLLALALPQSVKAYSFSAVCSTGQTLYYNINGSNVTVTYPGSSQYDPYHGYTHPTGVLVIPSSVTNNGTTYSVTSIDGYAFYQCSGLTSVTIPNSVISIDGYAFYQCSGLTSVTIPNSITSIGRCTFRSCSGLTSVTIPNSVTSIGELAFENCSGLTSVSIGNSVDSIGDWAFCGCSGLTSVTIPNSVTSIGDDAFENCRGLTSLTIGGSVTSIGSGAFASCSGLTSVTIPNSVTSIGGDAFYDVRHIEYYGTATGAPWGAFHMNGVTNGDFIFSSSAEDTLFSYIGAGGAVVIPNTVTSIGIRAFYNCSGLTSVTIPNSVISIGEDAFYCCWGLTKITSWNEVPPLLGSSCFVISNMNIPVYVPCDAISAYQAASGWNEFTNYQCPPLGIRDVAEEECDVTIYQRNGQIVIEGAEGNTVTLYDAAGRLLSTRQEQSDRACFDVPVSGTYLVRIGNLPAKKVVVIR